jgi:hypothetical protein
MLALSKSMRVISCGDAVAGEEIHMGTNHSRNSQWAVLPLESSNGKPKSRTRLFTLSGSMAAVAALCLAGVASASAAGLTAPSPGVWKLHAANLGAPEIASGSFIVTAAQTVTNFSLVLGAGAESPCGTGALTVRVLGAHHLVRDPYSDLGSRTNEYAISSPSDVINPVKVSVTVNGEREAGALEIAFGPGSRGGAKTGGDLYYNDNNCDIFFGVAKG